MVDSSQSYLNGLNNEQMSLGGQLTKENLTIRNTPQLIAEKANAFEQAKTACSTDHLSTAVSNFITNHPEEGTDIFLNHDGHKFISSADALATLIKTRTAQVVALQSVELARAIKEEQWSLVRDYGAAVTQEMKIRNQIQV
jgi:hypothetical protein